MGADGGWPDADDAMVVLARRVAAGETVEVSSLDEGLDPFTVGGFDSTAVGIVWDTVAADLLTAHLDVDERHHQPYGIVHGGVWCSMIESMASMAAALRVAPEGRLCVGVSNATDFLRAHRRGRIEGAATPIHLGRLQQLWQVVLSRAHDDKPVARGQVRLQNVEVSQLGS